MRLHKAYGAQLTRSWATDNEECYHSLPNPSFQWAKPITGNTSKLRAIRVYNYDYSENIISMKDIELQDMLIL